MSKLNTPENIVDALEALYSDSVSNLSAALEAYLHKGETPAPEARQNGAFCYPELVIHYNPDGPPPPISRAFGKMSEPGTYASTITQPGFFRRYLVEQLTPLLSDYEIDIEVRKSDAEIPYAYIWDQAQADGLDEINPTSATRLLTAPCSNRSLTVRSPCSMARERTFR